MEKILTVNLIAITQPIDTRISVDEFVAYVARVSNPENQNNHLTSQKLLRYLVKHKHWSPFEMVNLVFEVNTTRDIGRQMLRHRSFSWQEFSQRYADPNSLGFTTREARLQDHKNRQNSIETEDADLSLNWEEYQEDVKDHAARAYKWAIDNGIAKEVARSVLPEGLVNSRLYMNGTLRSYIHYCQVRMDPSTQKEHRIIAKEIWRTIIEYFPSLEEINIEKKDDE